MTLTRRQIQGGKLPKNIMGQVDHPNDEVAGGTRGTNATPEMLAEAKRSKEIAELKARTKGKSGGMPGAGVEDNAPEVATVPTITTPQKPDFTRASQPPWSNPVRATAPVTRPFPQVPSPGKPASQYEGRENSIKDESKSSQTGPNTRARQILEEANSALDVKLMTPEELRAVMELKYKEGKDIKSTGYKQAEETQAQAYAKNRFAELLDRVVANMGQIVAGATGLATGLNVAKDYKKEYLFDRKLEDEVVKEQTSLMKAATKALADGKEEEAKQLVEVQKALGEIAQKNAAEKRAIGQAMGTETFSTDLTNEGKINLVPEASTIKKGASSGATPKETLSQRVPINPSFEKSAEETLNKIFGDTGKDLLRGPTEAAYAKTWAPLNEKGREDLVNTKARRMLFDPAKLKERAVTYPVQERIERVMHPNFQLNGKPIDNTMRKNMIINILRDGDCVINERNEVVPARPIPEMLAKVPYYPADGDVRKKHMIGLINAYLNKVRSIPDKEAKYAELGRGGYGGSIPSYMDKTATVIPEKPEVQ
jgi:hypothetical protein